MKSTLTTLILIFAFFNVEAQLEKVLHQTFEIGEVENINLDFYGEYKIEPWAGNTVMTETQIRLTDASPAILKHFVEKAKRYDVVLDLDETTASFSSHDKERRTIESKYGQCYEEINMRIFVPDSYDIVNEKSLVRKEKNTDE